MPELYPSDTELTALSGTADAAQEVYYPPIGESPYYLSFYRMLHRMLDVARRAGDLRVYQDGELTFGVRAGTFMDGPVVRTYEGSAGNALPADGVSAVYLLADASLGVSQQGFPNPAVTPHLPLAQIATADGTYALSDILDQRGRAMFRLLEGLHPAATREGLTTLATNASDQTGDARAITLQVVDAAGAALAGRFRLRVWIATADYGAPDATDNAVAVTAGTVLATRTAHADYELLTAADGSAAFTLTVAGAASRHIMAESNGRIASSGALAWEA